ncbi:MAG: DGQHR domain-containing protein [Dehalococcoidia bacterium]|nr:MAG: DGQHR domain-containing protein [Dehalococcoidia bacterium]
MMRFRALKGRMGTTDFYLCTASLSEVARQVDYKESKQDWAPEVLQQRPLNVKRVTNEMVPYLVENEDHFYNTLVVEHVRPGEIHHDINFVPDEQGSSAGWIEIEAEKLEALDGQHRLKSIQLAVEQRPELGRETIALMIVPHKSAHGSQQMFSDLNRNAKPTPKPLNVLFEHREIAALLAKDLAKKSRVLSGRVHFTSSSLSERSPYITTLPVVYEATKVVESVLPSADDDYDAALAFLVKLWDTALGALPGVDDVVSGARKPAELRRQYVYATSVGIEALADVIRAAVTEFPATWHEILSQGLRRIDWGLGDVQWEGVALFAGRAAIGMAARRRTATLIKHLLGLPVDDKHREDLEEVYRAFNRKLPSPLLVPAAV